MCPLFENSIMMLSSSRRRSSLTPIPNGSKYPMILFTGSSNRQADACTIRPVRRTRGNISITHPSRTRFSGANNGTPTDRTNREVRRALTSLSYLVKMLHRLYVLSTVTVRAEYRRCIMRTHTPTVIDRKTCTTADMPHSGLEGSRSGTSGTHPTSASSVAVHTADPRQQIQVVLPDSRGRDDSARSLSEQMQMMMMSQMMSQQMAAQHMQFAQMNAMMQNTQGGSGGGNEGKSKSEKKKKPSVNIKSESMMSGSGVKLTGRQAAGAEVETARTHRRCRSPGRPSDRCVSFLPRTRLAH